MIILGMGQHAPLDRWLGDETALKVIRMATVPVLAAARETAALPGSSGVKVSGDQPSQHLDTLLPLLFIGRGAALWKRVETAMHDDTSPAEQGVDLVDLEGDGPPAASDHLQLRPLRCTAVDPAVGEHVTHRLNIHPVATCIGEPPYMVSR
jgi:hypothetical protein